jgi:hypothetical protein
MEISPYGRLLAVEEFVPELVRLCENVSVGQRWTREEF